MSSPVNLSESDLEGLRNQIYQGYRQIPKTRRAHSKGGFFELPQEGGGEINYSAYGGENVYNYQHDSPSPFKSPDHPDNKNAKNWRAIATHLGIEKPSSEDDLRRMYDFVKGHSMQKEGETVQEPSEPPVFTPSEAHQEARGEYESTRDNPIPRMSDQIGANAMADAIRHGDDLNDWYQRDTEARKAEAKLGAYEMGERTRFLANQFAGKIPELGDVGKLYESYADKLKDMG